MKAKNKNKNPVYNLVGNFSLKLSVFVSHTVYTQFCSPGVNQGTRCFRNLADKLDLEIYLHPASCRISVQFLWPRTSCLFRFVAGFLDT